MFHGSCHAMAHGDTWNGFRCHPVSTSPASASIAGNLRVPANMRIVLLPPYSPVLGKRIAIRPACAPG